MTYNSANSVLPDELIEQIQRYVDGGYLYIPRKRSNQKAWGENNGTRTMLRKRNQYILDCYLTGISVSKLAKEHFLSEKSIYRIIRETKKKQY